MENQEKAEPPISLTDKSKEHQTDLQRASAQSIGSVIEHAQPQSVSHCSNSDHKKKHWLEYATFGGALVAAIAAVAAAGFTWYQASIAQDTAKQQLRGYLVIGSNDIPKLAEGIQPFVKVTIQNMGQTPIYDGAWISGLNVMNYPMRGDIENDDCRNVMNHSTSPKWMIGKESQMEKWRPTPFQADEVKLIQEGKAAIYLHGRICYRDIFKQVRYTDFCMHWKWENGRMGTGLACEEGNGGS